MEDNPADAAGEPNRTENKRIGNHAGRTRIRTRSQGETDNKPMITQRVRRGLRMKITHVTK